MSHADVPPSPNQLYTDRNLSNQERQEINRRRQQQETEKEKIVRLMVEYQEERKQLWRDSMVAFIQSGKSYPMERCVEVADALLEEYDKRFKNVRI